MQASVGISGSFAANSVRPLLWVAEISNVLVPERQTMNTKLATTLVIGALLAPAAVYAADRSMTEKVKETVADSVITTKIKAEFAKDRQVSALNVKVDTDDKGVVTLSGRAKSKAEADKAVKIARDTKGVTSVKNDILVQGK